MKIRASLSIEFEIDEQPRLATDEAGGIIHAAVAELVAGPFRLAYWERLK